MQDTTWMNAKTAKENGFIDEIMFEDQKPALANADGSLTFNPGIISKIKNLMHSPKPEKKATDDVDKPTQENKSDKGQAKNNLSLLLWN